MKLKRIKYSCLFSVITFFFTVAEVQADSTKTHLSSIHGLSETAPTSSKYLLFCGGCHGVNGMGDITADIPAMPPKVGAFMHDPEGGLYLLNVGGVMSAGITDADAAEIMNYILVQFGKETLPADWKPFVAEDVTKLRAKHLNDVVKLRVEIAERLAKKGIDVPSDYPWH